MEPVTPSTRILQIIAGHWLACSVYTAAKLNLADLLANGQQSVEALAAASSSHAPSLYRLLRALAAEGIFEETSKGVFSITPAATALQEDAPGNVKAFVLALLGEHYHGWGELLYSVQTGGIAFDHHFGTDIWSWYRSHPAEGLNFMKAMTAMTQYVDKAIIAAYDFSGFNTIVDVGGGNGALLMAILKATPAATGIVYDAPYVIEKTAEAIAANGLTNRCGVKGGDFFKSVPPGADAYIMKYILHDWYEEDAIRLLRNCSEVMKPGDKLLAFDAVIPEGNGPHPGKLFDITMLVATGGRERTAQEFQYLFEQAGLQFNRVIPLALPDVSIVEGEKL